MENSVAHLETKISRLNRKDMKKQDSLRYLIVSGFLRLVEMLRVLHSLWETLFPFALLWWNVMLCATCARYYSWNRSRFRIRWTEPRFYGDVEEGGEKGALPLQVDSPVEMEVLTCLHHGGSHTGASHLQEMELGCCLLQQSLPSTQGLDDDMLLCDAHVDSVAEFAEERHVEESKSGNVIMSSALESKAMDLTLPSSTSKLSFLAFDERKIRQSGLLEAAYWTACPCLLPQQIAPLARYDSYEGPEKLLECLWMQSTERAFVDVKALVQVLRNIYTKSSSLEEHLRIGARSFVVWFFSMLRSKEHAYLEKQIVQYLRGRASRADVYNMQLASSYLNAFNLATEPLEGRIMEHLGLDIGMVSPSSPLSDLELNSDVHHTCVYDEEPLENHNKKISECESSACTIFGLSLGGYNSKRVSGSQSNVVLDDNFDDENVILSRQMEADAVYFRPADPENNFLGSPIQLNGVYHDFYERSADWGLKYGDLQWAQDVESAYAGYYDTGAGVLYDYNHFDSCESDYTIGGGDLNGDNDGRVHGNSSDVKQPRLLDTWWDEGAVHVGEQEHKEDSIEQAWQVV